MMMILGAAEVYVPKLLMALQFLAHMYWCPHKFKCLLLKYHLKFKQASHILAIAWQPIP